MQFPKSSILFLNSIGILLFSLFVVGCEKPNPEPENLDPIYSDLMKESDSAKNEAAAAKIEIQKLNEDLTKVEARDPSRPLLISQRISKEKALNGLEQRTFYFHLRAEHRKEIDRKEYAASFKSKKLWPDPKEYERYKEFNKLQSVSRNWDDRVPKTNRYDKPKSSIQQKAKSE